MASFARPELLLLTLLAPLAWRLGRARPRAAVRFPATALFDGLPAGPAIARRRLLVVAIALTWAVAAAGPRRPDYATPIPAEGVTIVLIVDVSGSMAEPFGGSGESRLSSAVESTTAFVSGGGPFPGRAGDAIGLVTFAELPRTLTPPTAGHALVTRLLAGLTTEAGAAAGTSVGDALAEGLTRVDPDAPGRTVFVLVSDGEENGGGRATSLPPLEAARLAEAYRVPVHVIDLSAGDSVSAGELLERVADLTGGRAFRASDGAAVTEALVEIDALERRPVEAGRFARYHDLTGVFVVASALLVLTLWVLDGSLWRVRP